MHAFDGSTMQQFSFQQPPRGYPQFDARSGTFVDEQNGVSGARYVCVCTSNNLTEAGYAGTGAYDQRTHFGPNCQGTHDNCASTPCQNEAECAVDTSLQGYTCTCTGGYQGIHCEFAEHQTTPQTFGAIRAEAIFNQDGVVGSIRLAQDATNPTAPTDVVVNLTGLEDGPNPWHVHGRPVTIPGDCSQNSTGGHFLDTSKDHGNIWDLGAAMSLLGAEAPIDALPGVVNMATTDATLPLSGDQSVIGKSIVIHKKTNNQRWVCATITQVAGAATNGYEASCGAMQTMFSDATEDKTFTGDCHGVAADVCHVFCKDGYRTHGQNDYTCSAAGAWGDDRTPPQSPYVSCADIDECDPSPCVNGACADSISHPGIPLGSYECTCTAGFFGTNCDAPTNECESNPCENCETNDCCADGDATYTCTCKPGYEGDNCATDVDECDPSPCQNSATCADSNTDPHGVEPGRFRCDCVGPAASYHGELCDSQTDFCQPMPCVNGAACTSTSVGYSCQCASGYDGDNCNNDIDECASAPCQNDATCDQRIGTYSCTCTSGFLGTNCDATENNCDSNPCQHGSDCATSETAYTCTCAAGFVGENCDANDPCTTSPCVHGTCDGSTGSPVCACALGWHGALCGTETDECKSSPCVHGAACTDGDNAYTCACAAGFEGHNCDATANPCTPNPCQNSGTCSAGDDGAASCACSAGWHGGNCESNIDECAATPCLNGGACTDGDNAFTCACADGFTGATCENQCAAGTTPNGDKTLCEDCPARSAGTDGTCAQCPAGKKAVPATRSTSCDDCTGAEAGSDGTCAPCAAGRHANENHQSCTDCDAGQYRAAGDATSSCSACPAGTQPNGGRTECVACPPGQAGDTGICHACEPGKEGSPNHPTACFSCGDGTSSADGIACLLCPDGQSANPDHTDCVVASQVGESGSCELTNAAKCLVLDSVAVTTPVSGRDWNNDAAEELANGFVYDSTDEYIANLLSGPCSADNCDQGGIVVLPLGKGDASTFTAEIAVDSMEACQGLIDLFVAQMADPNSSLMSCSGGSLDPCWTIDPAQTLNTHCIDTTGTDGR